ncbi:hypothetical protein AB6A40_005955 [Gnathostoma spinigerum]|uniref:Uncharacterized protein n=1 Tax=Gnathostoma spinigerum TaxID=75299 RepID=A0ABD6EJ13_9BILA
MCAYFWVLRQSTDLLDIVVKMFLFVFQLLSTIETWDNEDCTNTSGEWYRIGEELTEIEFMYQKEVARSESLEWKSTHIVVGATGGIAVVALAISIFWGLNGTAFTSHC